MKILYVEDHDLVRESVKMMLMAHNNFDAEIDEAQNGVQALEMITKKKYDILLLDIGLPKKGGISVVKTLRKSNDDIKIIALTMYREESIIKQMIDAGIQGFVIKSAGIEELIKAVNTVYLGQKYYCNEVAQLVINDVVGKKTKSMANSNTMLDEELTKREREVLELLVKGKTTKEIAENLKLSDRTISNHRGRMLSKFKVNNTASLVSYAVENELV